MRERLLGCPPAQEARPRPGVERGLGVPGLEAMRRVPEGECGPWWTSRSAAAVIETPALRGESVLRPSRWWALPRTLRRLLEGCGQGGRVCVEAVVGWNALTRCADRVAALSGLRALMRAGGELSALAEVVPRESQRLSELADQEEPAWRRLAAPKPRCTTRFAGSEGLGRRAQTAARAAEAGLSEACEGVDTWGSGACLPPTGGLPGRAVRQGPDCAGAREGRPDGAPCTPRSRGRQCAGVGGPASSGLGPDRQRPPFTSGRRSSTSPLRARCRLPLR